MSSRNQTTAQKLLSHIRFYPLFWPPLTGVPHILDALTAGFSADHLLITSEFF